jgi:endo-1,4-beta-D-glucanase Y
MLPVQMTKLGQTARKESKSGTERDPSMLLLQMTKSGQVIDAIPTPLAEEYFVTSLLFAAGRWQPTGDLHFRNCIVNRD